MTNSGNDRKAPPGGPKRPAPAAPAAAPAKPQPPAPRVGGSAVGGAAAGRPLPQGARPLPPGARPQPPSRPLPPIEEAEPEAKTTAINLADLGLDSDEATVSVDADAIRAKASLRPAPPARPQPARPAPAAAEEVEEKTTAFRVEDLPPHEEEPKRPPQKTLLGHPAPKPGAAVRGAPAPAKRQETVALAKAPIAAAAAPDDGEATTAMNMDDMLARIETDNAPAEEEADEKTSALSLDDIASLEEGRAKMQRQAAAMAAGGARPAPAAAKPAPVRPAPAAKPAPAPVAIAEDERTMAVSLEDMPAPVRRAPAKAAPAARAPAPEPVEDDMVEVEEVAPPTKFKAKPAPGKAAPGAAKPGMKPAAKAAGGGKFRAPAASSADVPSGEGFVGAIRYALAYGGLEAQMEAGVIPQQDLDSGRKKQGFINLIIVGGSLAVLMTVFAFL